MANFISFNVNSLRQRLHQVARVVSDYQPFIIGLQETKVQDEEFPIEELEELGYDSYLHGQKTHYGVALLSTLPLLSIEKGFPNDTDDSQRRLIRGSFQLPSGKTLHVINAYFPQGESQDHPQKYPNKRTFYKNLHNLLHSTYKPEDALIVMGDMNVAPEDKDIGIGENNRKRWLNSGKCSFLPEERAWLAQLLDWGLYDTYRHCYPENNVMSWFDYRSRGFDREPKRGLRIDFILATQSLLSQTKDAGIDHKIRGMDRPSDHCPVWATLDI